MSSASSRSTTTDAVTLFPPRLLLDGISTWQEKLAHFLNVPVLVWAGNRYPSGYARTGWMPSVGTLVTSISMEIHGEKSVVAELCISDTILDLLCEALIPEAEGSAEDRLAFGAPVALETGNILLNALFAHMGRKLDDTYSFSVPRYVRRRFDTLDTASSLLIPALAQIGIQNPAWIGLRISPLHRMDGAG